MIMGYILIGLIWSVWLEWYTTNNIDGILGRPWIWRERLFHSILWPLSLATFVYEFFKQLFK